jgi:hypothetical protein
MFSGDDGSAAAYFRARDACALQLLALRESGEAVLRAAAYMQGALSWRASSGWTPACRLDPRVGLPRTVRMAVRERVRASAAQGQAAAEPPDAETEPTRTVTAGGFQFTTSASDRPTLDVLEVFCSASAADDEWVAAQALLRALHTPT